MLCKCTSHTLLLNQNILTEFIDLSVDLPLVGDRLFLSRGLRRDCVRVNISYTDIQLTSLSYRPFFTSDKPPHSSESLTGRLLDESDTF